MPLQNGQSIGRYHLLEPLGEGGMAVVYKAYDTHLECEVAVKVIRIDNLPRNAEERALKRFEREAKAVAKLNHPNIVKVTDYGEEDGKPYLVMPYLPGGTLKQLIKERGQIPWQEAAQLLIPIAEALAYAHEEKVIHRDVKPSNILLTSTGQPMLTDFGVAKVIEDEATQDLTGTSATVGTPEYMAPEQITSKTVDARADLYSLGVVFYEMVTGRKPFEADTPMAVLFKHASDPLPNPSQFVASLSKGAEYFLIKALAKKPGDRFQSADEMIKTLRDLIANPSHRVAFKPKHTNLSPRFGWISLVGIFIIILGIYLATTAKTNKDFPTIPSDVVTSPTLTFTLLPSSTKYSLPTSTLTPEPTITATAIPIGIPAQIVINVKCRKGPSDYLYGYDLLLEPQQINILGQNTNGTWIYFQAKKDNKFCWSSKGNITANQDISSIDLLPDPEIQEEVYFIVDYATCYPGPNYGWVGKRCTAKPECSRLFTKVSNYDAAIAGHNDGEYSIVFRAFGYVEEAVELTDEISINCPLILEESGYLLNY